MKIHSFIFFGFICISNLSFSLENISGIVTVLEPTYLPGSISFQLDTGNATCPAGTWLKWQKPDLDNNKAVYSTLLAAITSGMKINFIFNDNDSSCFGKYLHIKKD